MLDIRETLRQTGSRNSRRLPYEEIAEAILGDSYELSLVICGDTLARRMNKEHRQKSYAPNVLSFPLTKSEGEIFLNVRKAERESKQFVIPLCERLAHLFIHGCFHLKGLDHGDEMEKEERRIMKRFNLGNPR